jgi:hypothetical protein
MKTFRTLAATALLTLLVVAAGSAQQPTTPLDPHHPDAGKGTPATPGTAPLPTAGMPMEMCRQMMGDMMAMPMMGGAMSAGPKERADMLQMRGEMMKAMGDIMMKHARRMQGVPAK